MENSRVGEGGGGYTDGETGPEVLSGTGQQLAREGGEGAEWLEVLIVW